MLFIILLLSLVSLPGQSSSLTPHVTCPNCKHGGCSGNMTCTHHAPLCLLAVRHNGVEETKCVSSHECHGHDHVCCSTQACVDGIVNVHHQDTSLLCPKCDSFPNRCESHRKICHSNEACMQYSHHDHNNIKTDCKKIQDCQRPAHDITVLRCCTDNKCIANSIFHQTTVAPSTQTTTIIQKNSPCSECSDYIGHVCTSTSTSCPEDCMIKFSNGILSTKCVQHTKCHQQQALVSGQASDRVTCCNDLQCYTTAIMKGITGITLSPTTVPTTHTTLGTTAGTTGGNHSSIMCPRCIDAATAQCMGDQQCYQDESCMIQSNSATIRTGCIRKSTCNLESGDTTRDTTCCNSSICVGLSLKNSLLRLSTTTTRMTSTTTAVPTTTRMAITPQAAINLQNPSIVINQGATQSNICKDNDGPNLSCVTMDAIWKICSAVSGSSFDVANTLCRKTCNRCQAVQIPGGSIMTSAATISHAAATTTHAPPTPVVTTPASTGSNVLVG